MIFILLTGSLFLQAQQKNVKVKLVQYIPYCGGAKPTPEIIKSTEKPVAYANKKLICISDKEKVDTIVTDKSGNLNKTLPYGTYQLVEPWKYYKKVPEGLDDYTFEQDCLKNEWAKADLKITVSKKTTLIENNLKHLICPHRFPCIVNKHLPR